MVDNFKKFELNGTEFLYLILISPIIFAFVLLGIIIVWKTTANPDLVAPHLDKILVAFSIFSVPVSAAVTSLTQKLIKDGEKKK